VCRILKRKVIYLVEPEFLYSKQHTTIIYSAIWIPKYLHSWFQGANFRDLPVVRVRADNKVEFDPDVEREKLLSGKPLVCSL
jgi:hypothetical protein